MYNILEARIEYKDKQISRIDVLVEISKGDIRAIAANDQPKSGYIFITPYSKLTDELLQRVAGSGCQIQFSEADKIFPGWRKKHINGRQRN